MNKAFLTILSLLLILSLAACGTSSAPAPVAETEVPAEEIAEEPAAEVTAAPVAEESEPEDNTIPAEEAERILVVYFSSANTTGPDVVSGATPRVDDTGATVLLAQYIHEQIGGDIAPITVVEDYPEDYDATADQAKEEQDNDARPAFTLEVDPAEYDTIFIGYPIWWYRLPMIMNTFFETYDFSRKTIIPFNTHAGSRDGGTYSVISELEPNATVLDGLAVAGENVEDAEADVATWLTSLGY